jgi:hypothetical protein
MSRSIALVLLALAAPATTPALGFSPGEETTLSVKYLGLPTGEGKITVGQPAGDVWPIVFQARTRGLVGFLDVREHLTCLWDAPTGLPRGSDLRAAELGDVHADSLRFDRASGTATVTVQRPTRRSQKTVAVPPAAQDLTSAFMWLRLQPLQPGERHEVPVLTGSKLFTLTAEVAGAERVETPAGAFDAVAVRARVELTGQFSTQRDVRLWFSDDPRHVLVRVEADFAVGSVRAELVRYVPGAAVAMR